MIGLQRTPHLDNLWGMAVKLEPGKGARKGAAMRHGSLLPNGRVDIPKVALQHENLPQVLDVATRERQDAKARPQFLRAGMMLVQEPDRQ